MADKEKHTIEDVLAQYAQTEEGAAHLAEIEGQGRKASTKQAPKVPMGSQSAQDAFAEQVQEALNRPSMKDEHETRLQELKAEIRDNNMGFLELPLESLPTGGIFYPEGTKIYVRAASGGDIRHWSMTDETDITAIDNALTYIIERCMRISFPTGQATYKDLKEIDKFYVILAIRDFTFPEGNNDLKIKISENSEVVVHKDDVSFIDLGEKIMKYYNPDKRCFTFNVTNPAVGSINVYMPNGGVNQWLNSYIARKEQRQEQYDKDFIQIAPLLIEDYRGLTEASYAALIRNTMNWGPKEWSLMKKVKGILQKAITPKLTYIDESGTEQETPLNFQGGILALFNIDLESEFDL